jgi:hypothetical protein
MVMLLHGGAATNAIAKHVVDAFAAEVRAEALREAHAAIEDPKQRKAVGGGLGWETARDVVHNLLRRTTGGAR